MINSIELFVCSEQGDEFYSSSKQWKEIYLENNFLQQDHLYDLCKSHFAPFLIWDHIAPGDDAQIIMKNRKKVLRVNCGVIFCAKIGEKRVFCFLGLDSKEIDKDSFISNHKKHLADFANSLFFAYEMSSQNELCEYIQRSIVLYKESESIPNFYGD